MRDTRERGRNVAVSDYEMEFWQDCSNTFHEEQKQLAYASRMGLLASWHGAHPPTFDIGGRSVIDIGGGPVSLLLKCVNRGRSVVADVAQFPPWVIARYEYCDIEFWRTRGEDIDGYSFDEAWIYNLLQHVDEPAAVILAARRVARTIRIFEWIDIEPYPGHPHMLTRDLLGEWLGAPGFVANVNESGAVGHAYYGVFSTPLMSADRATIEP
jgi:hypothetical protein